MENNWQPIETAPRDGTWIIALRPGHATWKYTRVVVVQWSDDYLGFIWPSDSFDIFKDDINEKNIDGEFIFDEPFISNEFTHWMPLPEMPNEN